MKNKMQTRRMALLGIFIGFELVLMLTPLGYIPIGPLKATTLHIPVILIAVACGWKEGAILGAVFGLTSIVMNTITPTPVSFVFTPFYSFGELHGNFFSLLIALLPRILIGVSSGLIMQRLRKFKINETVSVLIASIIGSLCNTVLVMGGIYVFFGPAYAAVKEIAYDALMAVIWGTITTNGVLEAILAAMLVTAVYKAIKPLLKGVYHA